MLNSRWGSSIAMLALLLAIFVSNVQADPVSVNATIPSVDGKDHGVVLVIAGLLYAFFGHKFFRITLFLAGFYVFAALAWISLRNLEPSKGYGDNAEWIYAGVTGAVGFLGGLLFIFLWQLGLASVGGIAGFYLAIFILSWTSSGVISNEVPRIIFIVVLSLIGAALTFFFDRHVVIIGTAIAGSGSFFVGLDNFIHTGFQEAFASFLSASHKYHVTSKIYGMLAGVLCLTILGAAYQYRTHRDTFVPKSYRKEKRQKGENENEAPYEKV
ncbi:hypothetical protein BGZ76_005703 [Entomortierella beljakovae]|nr:hypothetical protein BGZ76_005703 [Entomortierella beljakovae]